MFGGNEWPNVKWRWGLYFMVKGSKHTKEARKRQSEANKGKHLSLKTEFKKGEHSSNRSEFKKGHIVWNKGLTKETNTVLLQISNLNKGKKLTEEHRKNIGKSRKYPIGEEHPMYGKKQSKKSIEKMKQSLKIFYIENPEQKGKISEEVKQLWQNPEFVKKQMKSRNVMPNKAESRLKFILNQVFFENQFNYVGDGKEIIGGKCPDFIDPINNKIIELYGDYWHKGQNPQDRINYFKNYGYDTLVIWESELKDMNSLTNRILEFICQ